MSQEKIGKRLKQALQITGYPKRQETYENVLELLIRETQIKTTMNSLLPELIKHNFPTLLMDAGLVQSFWKTVGWRLLELNICKLNEMTVKLHLRSLLDRTKRHE